MKISDENMFFLYFRKVYEMSVSNISKDLDTSAQKNAPVNCHVKLSLIDELPHGIAQGVYLGGLAIHWW